MSAINRYFRLQEHATDARGESLAERLTENGRELEGPTARLYAHWQYLHAPITRETAETVVRDLAAEVAEDEAALQQAKANSGYRKGILDRHQLRAPFSGVISSRTVDLGQWVTPGQAVLGLVSAK